MRMHVRTKGMGEIQAMLRDLPQAVRGEALRESALDGAEPIREQAVANALKHKRTGNLAESVEKEVARESLGDRVVVHIGPTQDGWYGRLLEMGHAIVHRGQRREYRRAKKLGGELLEWEGGYVPPYPWLRPALDTKRREAAERVMKSLTQRIDRVVRRARGRAT